MQDIEFTIEEGRLWMLQIGRYPCQLKWQSRNLSTKKLPCSALGRTRLMSSFIQALIRQLRKVGVLAKGLPAGPGGAKGRVVFTADDAKAWVTNSYMILTPCSITAAAVSVIYTMQAQAFMEAACELKKTGL